MVWDIFIGQSNCLAWFPVNYDILLCTLNYIIQHLVGSGGILATLLTKPMNSHVSTAVTSGSSSGGSGLSAFNFSAKPTRPSTGSIMYPLCET